MSQQENAGGTSGGIDMLTGFSLHVSNYMSGLKYGVLDGHAITVSPELFAAIKKAANSSELETLLKSVQLLNVRNYVVAYPSNVPRDPSPGYHGPETSTLPLRRALPR